MKTPPLPESQSLRSSGGSSRSNRPTRTRSLSWLWILGGVLLLGAVVAASSARPAWRRIKTIRAHRFLAEAEAQFRGSNWTAGFEKTGSALQLAPTDPLVLRHAARTYARIGRESAFRYFDALLASPAGNTGDREEMATLALRLNALSEARRQIEVLLADPNPSPRSLILGARLALAQGDRGEALRLARVAAGQAPTDASIQLAVAIALAASDQATDHASARQILWPLARTNSPLQVQSLSTLLSLPSGIRSEREEIERILTAMPERTLAQEIALADARATLDPSSRDRVADALLTRYSRGSTEEVMALGFWLNRNQLQHLTRGLVPEDVALSDRRLFLLRYQTLLGLSDVRGAYDLVTLERAPGHPFEIEQLRCETAIRLKNRPAVEAHFRNLLALARKDVVMLRSLASFALREGYRTFATDALQALSSSPRDTAIALLELARIADANGETWIARDYARKLAGLQPGNEAIKLQAVYYDLLLKEDIDSASRTAEALQKGQPSDLNRRTVLALARLRQGNLPEALGLVGGDLAEWSTVPPGSRSVIVAVLAGSGRTETAIALLNRIPIKLLKPEERELIKPVLTAAASEPAPAGSRRDR